MQQQDRGTIEVSYERLARLMETMLYEAHEPPCAEIDMGACNDECNHNCSECLMAHIRAA